MADNTSSQSPAHAHGRFDQGREHLGTVYAKALLGAAQKAGKIEPVMEELESVVVDVLNKLPQWEATLASPRVPTEDKLRMLDQAFRGKMSTTMLHFLKVLTEHGRFDCLRAVRHAARHLYNQMRGRIEVEIRTAQPLSNPLRQTIADRLKGLLGKEVELTTEVRPELLGGIVVKVGDTLYDGSLANQLERTRAQAIEATMQSIRRSVDRFATA
jgi:F-type H+-transporting ATPase subunit delta